MRIHAPDHGRYSLAFLLELIAVVAVWGAAFHMIYALGLIVAAAAGAVLGVRGMWRLVESDVLRGPTSGAIGGGAAGFLFSMWLDASRWPPAIGWLVPLYGIVFGLIFGTILGGLVEILRWKWPAWRRH